MPTYTDNTAPRYEILPEGDYIWTVEPDGFEIALSQGGKTNGAECYKVKFRIESADGALRGQCNENLIDHPSTLWKLDCFLKSGGVEIVKGESYEFNQVKATNKKIRWIDPIGLRGWCRVIVEEYDKKDKAGKLTGEKGRSNKISVFYTDRKKLSQLEATEPAEAPADEDAGF